MENQEEIWKDIPGFEGRYQCSNLGNFKSLPNKVVCEWMGKEKTYNRKERILRCSYEGNGYLQVGLQVEMAKQVRFLAHRLIAMTFLEKIDGLDFVNHINGIKDDNRVCNLEWVTKSRNCIHSFEIGLQCNKGVNHPRHKLTESDVLAIRSKRSNGVPARILAKEYHLSLTHTKDVIKRKSWPHI